MQGGWQDDESVEDAARRETIEEGSQAHVVVCHTLSFNLCLYHSLADARGNLPLLMLPLQPFPSTIPLLMHKGI